jgi:DNA repair exonuclease SbcCD ATPase subunit
LEQVGKLTMELNQVKDSCVKVKKDIATLTEDLQDARSQNGNLQNEKQDLLSKQKKLEDDAKKATQAVIIFKNENATLKSTVDKLKANQAAPAVGGARLSSMTDQDKAALEQQIKGLEEQKVGLEKALEEWTALAKVCIPGR